MSDNHTTPTPGTGEPVLADTDRMGIKSLCNDLARAGAIPSQVEHVREVITSRVLAVYRLADRVRALEAERDTLRAELAALRRAGALLANCAFNLKQRNHLTDNERRSLEAAQVGWDTAVAALRASGPASPCPLVLAALDPTRAPDDEPVDIGEVPAS